MFMLNSGFLELCKLHYLVYGSRESVYVLATSLSEVRLTAATALDELGCLAHHLTGIERVVFHEVVAHAYVEHRFLVSYRAYNSEQVRRNSLTQNARNLMVARVFLLRIRLTKKSTISSSINVTPTI